MGEGNSTQPELTKRYVAPNAEKLLYKEVELTPSTRSTLIDYIGGDPMIEYAATGGHGRSIFPGTTPSQAKLFWGMHARMHHAPFKATHLKLQLNGPISVLKEVIYDPEAQPNEASLRYSVAPDGSLEFHNPDVAQIRAGAMNAYGRLADLNLARELSRSVLGMDQETGTIVTLSLPATVRIAQRLGLLAELEGGINSIAPDVKREYRVLSEILLNYAQAVAPVATKVLEEELTREERKQIIAQCPDLPHDRDIVTAKAPQPLWQPALTGRVMSPGLEARLFEPTPLLDHGFIQAVDYMGDDTTPAQSARISYGKGTSKLSDDVKLARSLVGDEHTTPIEAIRISYQTQLPLFSDPRQAARHRTTTTNGFLWWWPVGDLHYTPDRSQLKYQDKKNRQGRGRDMEEHERDEVERIFAEAFEQQKAFRESANPLEAREASGVGHYTRMFHTVDGHNVANFIRLRSDPHAQYEVRVASDALKDLVRAHVPEMAGAMDDHIWNAVKLSVPQQEYLREFDGDVREATNQLVNDERYSTPIKETDPRFDPALPSARELNRQGQTLEKKLLRMVDPALKIGDDRTTWRKKEE